MKTPNYFGTRLYYCDVCGAEFPKQEMIRDFRMDQFGNKYVMLNCGIHKAE